MLRLLSITPLDTDHIEEICQDLKDQQDRGISTCAMFMMTFHPEGTPPIPKAEYFCRKYDLFHEKLEKMHVKHGVLVQSTLGHGVFRLNSAHPFQMVIPLSGKGFETKTCPLDEGFHQYIKEQMKILASRNPEIILIDDDMGILYGSAKGCSCPLHMAEFNRIAGTNMTRAELWAHTQGTSEEDKYYTDIYVKLQQDALTNVARIMREGIDEVNPSIQGAISLVKNYCEAGRRWRRFLPEKATRQWPGSITATIPRPVRDFSPTI